MAKELLSWTCPQCGKVITSLYPHQFAQNKKAHLETHEENTEKGALKMFKTIDEETKAVQIPTFLCRKVNQAKMTDAANQVIDLLRKQLKLKPYECFYVVQVLYKEFPMNLLRVADKEATKA